MDGRKSTDREPRQGNLLGKTSSSTQAVDPFSVDRSLPLLFRSFSPALSRPPPRSSPSPSLPPSYPLLFFIRPRLLSISFSLFVSPRSTSRHIYPPLPPLFASLLLSRLSPSRDLLAPEESVFLYFLPLLRHDSIRSLPFLPCLPFPSFCPLPSGATSIPISPPPLLLVQLCSSNYISRLPPEYLSLSLLGFFCPSFRPSFLPSFVPYPRTHTHTYTYILHTCRHRVGTLSTKLSLSLCLRPSTVLPFRISSPFVFARKFALLVSRVACA